MTVSIAAQILEFAQALVLGAALGAFYGLTHRRGRRQTLADVLFALTAPAACTAFFLTVCGGLVRGYQIGGIGIGMLGMIRLFRAAAVRRQNGQKQNKREKA